MHRVVILGGGFGGLYAAQALKRAPAQITVIDRRNFHLFQPLLYQVATGGLSPGDIAAPLRWILRKHRNTDVLMAEACDFDVAGHRVIIENDKGSVPYDTLIVAAGATHHYFGHNDWERHAPGLKTIEDATEIRRKVLVAFEAAERESDPARRAAWLTFVVVGGGPTGVELAGTLGEITRDTLKSDFRRFRTEESRILLIDAGERILSTYPAALSTAAENSLIRLGVRTRNNALVTGVDEEGVNLKYEEDGRTDRIASRTVLWAAGVAASPLGKVLSQRTEAPMDRAGRILVKGDLTVPGYPEILVVGDLAHVENDGFVVPGVAPAAMQMGRYAAKVIEARLEGREAPAPFRYHDKGSMATIGRRSAVADFGRVHFSGVIAWLLWLFVHLMYLVGFQNRVIVFLKWAVSYFTYNRGARLITGETGDLPPVSQPLPQPVELAETRH
ncbi:MAG: NAD(P)/FAD-dependent oxidoreductase [Bryobacteraceae bacterium]|nr:NAD(P)/FAD-dependent oxidoreductase [Bryobacteraceae bacterium]